MTVAPQQLYTFRSSYTTLTYSKDDLRHLVAEIEHSFIQSDIYTRALNRLQEKLGSKAHGLQLLVNALGREAIRLTLKELISAISSSDPQDRAPAKSTPGFTIPPIQNTHSTPDPNFTPQPPSIPTPDSLPTTLAPQTGAIPTALSSDLTSTVENESQTNAESSGTIELSPKSPQKLGIAIAVPDHPVLAEESTEQTPRDPVIISWAPSNTPIVDISEHHPSRRITKTRPQPSTEREKALLAIGEALYNARCDKNISIEQLHQRTCVPNHHIKALEDGVWHHLPEDIYLKGFIRLLGNTLGLNGQELSQQLSASTVSSRGTVPLSRTTTKVSGHLPQSQLQQAHLYLGYAALMAGATGGLAWMVSQPTTIQQAEIKTPDTPEKLSLNNKHHPNQKAFHILANRIFEQINAIATPETLPPEPTAQPLKP